MRLTSQGRARLRLLIICLASFGLAALARAQFMPDIVPGADTPALWAADLLLRAIELGAGLGAILLLIAGLGVLYRRERMLARPKASAEHRTSLT